MEAPPAPVEYETDEHPMCEGLYTLLSQVQGFNDLNGSTYAEYVAKWRSRCPQLPPGSKPEEPHPQD